LLRVWKEDLVDRARAATTRAHGDYLADCGLLKVPRVGLRNVVFKNAFVYRYMAVSTLSTMIAQRGTPENIAKQSKEVLRDSIEWSADTALNSQRTSDRRQPPMTGTALNF
jgi:hypothetical protein